MVIPPNNPLDSIHERPLDLVEHNHPQGQHEYHKPEGIGKMTPGKGCHTHCAVFKGFNDRGYRIQHHNPLLVRRDGAQGIDHRGGIHPQLHNKAEQKGEVAVFGGH